MENKIPKVLRSSADENKIALTIKGVGVAVIPALILVLGAFGFEFTQSDLTQFVDSVATATSAVFIVYGLGRKLFLKFK